MGNIKELMHYHGSLRMFSIWSFLYRNASRLLVRLLWGCTHYERELAFLRRARFLASWRRYNKFETSTYVKFNLPLKVKRTRSCFGRRGDFSTILALWRVRVHRLGLSESRWIPALRTTFICCYLWDICTERGVSTSDVNLDLSIVGDVHHYSHTIIQ